ncbi:hypothetical protein ACV35H_33520, partial [Pseudomonas aeruginosa]
QVVFIGVHLPAYLVDQHLPAQVGTTVLALVGLFNVFGTYIAGWLGGRWSKPRLLTALYLVRGVVIVLFLWLPPSIDRLRTPNRPQQPHGHAEGVGAVDAQRQPEEQHDHYP